jgi:hypothetical protein
VPSLPKIDIASYLTATTNAYKYVQLIVDELVQWELMSDAEMAIFVNFVFCKLTRNGKSVFADRFFEWIVKSLRWILGKTFAQSGGEKNIVTTNLNLNEILLGRENGSIRAPTKRESTRDKTASDADLDEQEEKKLYSEVSFAFAATYVRAMGLKIWSDEPTETKNMQVQADKISSEFKNVHLEGEARAKAYYNNFTSMIASLEI